MPIGRLFSAPNSKRFAWNYGCNRRSSFGAWHAPGRRLEPHARLCVAVAQVVKMKAGCVATEGHELASKWKIAKEMVGRRLSQQEAKRLLAKFG